MKARQRGAVSIFTVIFSALLISIVTVSFVRIMVRDQQQATAADLSQSAYDSALVGVEDAKRLLIMCKQSKDDGSGFYEDYCIDMMNKGCTEAGVAINAYGISNGDKEVGVQTGGTDNNMQQAYTCLKIDPNPTSYVGVLAKDQSNVVPLTQKVDASDSPAPVKMVEIEWTIKEDVGSGGIENPPGNVDGRLFPQVWNTTWPAVLRLQYMGQGSEDKLEAETVDASHLELSGENSALFVRPSSDGISGEIEFSFPTSRVSSDSSSSSPKVSKVRCSTSLVNSDYYCKVRVGLPLDSDPESSGEGGLLRITSLYAGTHYSVKMINSERTALPFEGVQAEVWSNGRASDLFRQVNARIELTSIAPYPEAAVETTESLRKTLFVTEDRCSNYPCGD